MKIDKSIFMVFTIPVFLMKNKNLYLMRGHLKLMKRTSARAAALGLSTITLAGTVAFPVHAEASEESGSLVFVSEENIEQVDTQEKKVEAVAEETSQSVSAVSAEIEEINNDVDSDISISSAVDSVAAAQDDISLIQDSETDLEGAEEAMNQAVSEAVQVTSQAQTDTAQSNAVAQAAKAAVEDSATSKSEAEAIIVDTEITVAQAEENLEAAKTSYDNKLAEYEEAKKDYLEAADNYNNSKSQAISDLDSAQASLADAKSRLEQLEEELKQAQEDLVNSGAEALVAAEDSDKSDISSYIATVVQYYYAPETELAAGNTIENYTVTTSTEDYVTITYDIYDSDGNYLRTVSADYGYSINYETGTVEIFENNLIYQYTDASGQVITFTEEEAETLDYKVAIGKYWTATGFYIPRYTKANVNYKGTINDDWAYSDYKAALQGQNYLENLYNNNANYYNAVAEFVKGWKTDWGSYYSLDIYYDISYDAVVTSQRPAKGQWISYADMKASIEENGGYVISDESEYIRTGGQIRYIQAYEISDSVKNSEYSSYNDALIAIINEAKSTNGATGVDTSISTYQITENTKYQELEAARQNFKSLFSNASEDYVSYITSIRSKLDNYTKLLSQVAAAKENLTKAENQVSSLENQIAALNSGDQITVSSKIAALEAQLEQAKADYDQAQNNLADAKKALSDAKNIFNARFNSTSPATVAIYYPETGQIKEELEEEPEEEVVEETSVSQSHDSNGNYFGGDASEDIPEETLDEETQPEEEITIEDEETPLGITLAGVLERGKWFLALGGVAAAGAGVGLLEAKRRAAIKLIDKLNQ